MAELLVITYGETPLPGLELEHLERQFHVKTTIIDGVEKPVTRKRGSQASGKDYLSDVSTRRAGTDYAIGITDEDLYVPDLNFIFGLASRSLKSSIISIARLVSDDNQLYERRILTELTHELGHVFGLDHCNRSSCVMFFSNSLLDTDKKGKAFCHRCIGLLTTKVNSRKNEG
ncbi:MAG: hypothetical protein ACFFD4_24510 [Candidatus Odinarchaeota archaeon]